ncbi:hypothetical protein MCT08_10015 [Vibrio aestuarianus]|uniref:hypothetical protein n=1 Tax=Vibrio aestuarianus TaxID=28171 RepID=UPI00237CB1A8|nr:hypothetical protein [Vibrio aestuarianus]MDE1249932.1 hypothetical protein [Vibrio aestuarianus]
MNTMNTMKFPTLTIGCDRKNDPHHVKNHHIKGLIKGLNVRIKCIRSYNDRIGSISGRQLIEQLNNIMKAKTRIEELQKNDPSMKKSKSKKLSEPLNKLNKLHGSFADEAIKRSGKSTNVRPEQPLYARYKDTPTNSYWNTTNIRKALLLVNDPRLLLNGANLLLNGANLLFNEARSISHEAKSISHEAMLSSHAALSDDDLLSRQNGLSIRRKQFRERSNELTEYWGSLNEKMFERSCNSTSTIPEKPLDRRDKNIYTDKAGLALDEAKLLLDEAKLRVLTS